ncbi:hypothetical protein C2E23DRAFT_183171 [Lenzites betulinus]|nr:hypothetical protein C2E23DRAFT_183171 [Lenzites betulinus]
MAFKRLTFKSVDLGDDLTVILSFTPPSPIVSIERFPFAWKVFTIHGKGGTIFDAIWTNKYAFSVLERSGSTREISAGTYIPIEIGEVTALTACPDGDTFKYEFTNPVAVPGSRVIQANNNAGHPVDLALSVIEDPGTDTQTVKPILNFDNVGNSLSVAVQFRPILRVYAVLQSHTSEPSQSVIQSNGPILELDLLGLGPHTAIRISKDHTGAFVAMIGSNSGADDEDT